MFRLTGSRSHPIRDLGPDESSCSSDTGDILIRSTRVPLPDQRHEAGQGRGPVKITVQKLRNPVTVHDPPAEQRRPKPRQKPSTGAPPRSATDGRPDERRLKEPGRTKEKREPTPPTGQLSPDRKLPAESQNDCERMTGHDLLTSRFAAGSRGVVLAALRKRSHSAPHRKEVQLKLLDPGPVQTSSKDASGLRSSSQDALSLAGDQTEAVLSTGRFGDVTNAAAAAVAAAAPLIKAQSDMEARVCQLADGVQRLLQADREGKESGRSLSQQTLQHLETLHSQQLQLQSQLLQSALRMVTGHTPSDVASDQPAHLQVTHLSSGGTDLSNQQHNSSATRAAVETGPVTMATPICDRWPEQTRNDCHHHGTSVSMAMKQLEGTCLQSEAAVRRVNEVLKEMGRLKTEMKVLLTPETSVPLQDHHHEQQTLPPSQSQQNQPQQSQSRQNQSQPNQPRQNQSRQNQPLQILPQSSSVLLQERPVVPSLLEEAGQVLRQVQRQKRVLEENLEVLLRTKNRDVLHCQLEAMAANRDSTHEVRIKKTVDAWINTSSREIQAESPSEDAAVTSQLRATGSAAHSRRGRPVSVLRGAGRQTVTGGGGQGLGVPHRAVQGAEAGTVPGVLMDIRQVEGESYLTHLYGRAPYEGLRRTLKKGPYLRFSSPVSSPSRKPRPRLVESVRGVKVKSCKTQTSVTPPLCPSPRQPHHHLILSSSYMTSGDPACLTVKPADTLCAPMAIPLGRRRTERQQEVSSPPASPPTSGVVGGAIEQQSQREEQLDEDEAPLPPSHIIIGMKSDEEEDEENVFPGTHFLSVADVIQDEVSVVGEEPEELHGVLSPPLIQYQGPVFPPQNPPALPAQDQASIPDTDHQRDALENRLVEWVEQQLMSRIITEMYRRPSSGPAPQNISSDQSELEERSVSSDIVDTVGAEGLQLFVDSSMSVDSGLIRQLVHEVLAEIVALMLGQREGWETGPKQGLEPPGPGSESHQEDKLVPLVPTPVPTPPPKVDPPTGQTTPPTTPASEPTSLLCEDSPQPITAPELVTTPTPSPDTDRSTGSLAPHQALSPLTWGDAELPLDEERPEEQMDTHKHPLVMSVAEEEPALSSPLPTSPSPLAPDPGPGPGPDFDPRPSSVSSSSGESSSSSSAVTAALKHISEGELLISVNQLAAMTEDDVGYSLSSSLQELQDMDHDPPSEGQLRGHNLLLTLLTKMEQGVTHQGERPQPEGSWEREDQDQEEDVSLGEAREDGMTKSVSTAARQSQTSPGQISQCADVSIVSFEAASQGLTTTDSLVMEPQGSQPGQTNSQT
ncbi:protein TALPID3 isoform X2 [Echeneis naucrates]|nr:protein TALPID3 isoform X2 [Echeneis naucrates]